MISWREERRVPLSNWPSTARRSCTIKSQTNLKKACLTHSTAWRCLPTLLMARAFDSSSVIIIVIIYPLTMRVVGAKTDDFATSFLHFSLFPTALWDLENSRPVQSLMLSSHFFFCQPCLLPPFTVPCETVSVRPDERETWTYHCNLRLLSIWLGQNLKQIIRLK